VIFFSSPQSEVIFAFPDAAARSGVLRGEALAITQKMDNFITSSMHIPETVSVAAK